MTLMPACLSAKGVLYLSLSGKSNTVALKPLLKGVLQYMGGARESEGLEKKINRRNAAVAQI